MSPIVALLILTEDRGKGGRTTFVRGLRRGTFEGARISLRARTASRYDADGLVVDNRVFSSHPIFQVLVIRCPAK